MAEVNEALNVEEVIKDNTGEDVEFDIVICDNEPDRVSDVFSKEALKDIVDIINKLGNVPYIKNHDMSDVDNIIANIRGAELVEDTTKKNLFGDTYVYVLGKASAKKGSNDYLDKILSGLWKNSSIRSVNVYEEKDGFNVIMHVEDVIEVSCVCVGCQPMARVCLKSVPVDGNRYKATMDIAVNEIKETTGGKKMKLRDMMFKRICSTKGLPEDVVADINKAIDTAADAEISEDDVNALIEENAKLKEKIAELEAENESLKGCMAEKELDGAVEEAVKALNPLNDRVKADIIDKIDKSKITAGEDGKFAGLDEQIEAVKKMYDGLFKVEAKPDEVKPEGTKPEGKIEVAKSVMPEFTLGTHKAETGSGKMSERFGL